jgi:hypothetical protein
MFSIFNTNAAARGRAAISRQQALGCIPLKNPEIREETADNGEVRLIYQVRIKPWFAGIVKRMSVRQDTLLERKLQLDLLGSTVWRMIDGRRSVGEIIADFQADHRLTGRESELSITSFLRQLGKRGLIAMREGR